MLDLLQITNDASFARRCDALAGLRLFVDLEREGKAARQAGYNSFISTHRLEDIGRIRAVLRRARLMVRVNPLGPGSAAELDAVLGQGADCVMLPMFTEGAQLREFSTLLAGRVPLVALLETRGALECLDDWIGTPGLHEVYIGLNDLHLSLGCRFMFEPLADGHVERVARAAQAHGLRFGFGGIARLDDGLLPGSDVLAEHVRLGSGAVILSRAFHQGDPGESFEADVAALRAREALLRQRSPAAMQEDAERIAQRIRVIAAGLPVQA